MQQKLRSRGSSCSLFSEQNGQACGAGAPHPLLPSSSSPSFSSPSSIHLPFRCPRCGENERFRSLASLRAHLEYQHSFYTANTTAIVNPETLWHDMSLPTRRGQHPPWRSLHVRSLSDSRESSYVHGYDSGRRRTQSVGVGTQSDAEGETDEEDEEENKLGMEEQDASCGATDSLKHFAQKSSGESSLDGKNHLRHHCLPPDPPSAPLSPAPPPEPGPRTPSLERLAPGQSTAPGLDPSSSSASSAAAVRRRLASVLRAADSTMQRKLARVSTELAQTDTELLCELAHSQHLAQERREVAERERSLSRQVDVAVMVIATLREELNASENELERREREVITIQNFLESAARHETCGKVRIQRFIENLLKRIALAERLLDYYQSNGSPHSCNHMQQHHHLADFTENAPHKISKSRYPAPPFCTSFASERSAAGQLSSCCFHDDGTHTSSPFGQPSFSKRSRDRPPQNYGPERRDDPWDQRRKSTGYETDLAKKIHPKEGSGMF